MADAIFDEVAFKRHIQFSWQVQYLVKFNCHFSLQAQYLVKFRMIAGARDVVFFNTKARVLENHFSWQAQYLVMLEFL